MSIKADFLVRYARLVLLTSGGALAAALLGACTLVRTADSAPATAAAATTGPAPAAGTNTDTNDSRATSRQDRAPPAPRPETPPAGAGEPVLKLLAYADRVRAMSPAELGQEAARLGNPYLPPGQLQLALVLSQLRQAPELARAQELLGRLLANPDAPAQALHPLARLLAARLGEQRRLEELLDKQTQQTRDTQRRLDQTHERLEALKAIERSLTSRRPPAPAAAASAPASRNRTPAPAP